LIALPPPITDPDSLQDRELPKPESQGRGFLVRVEAVSVNPVDIKILHSQSTEHQEGTLHVLGRDVARIVETEGHIHPAFSCVITQKAGIVGSLFTCIDVERDLLSPSAKENVAC